MKIQIAVAIDNFHNWRASHQEAQALSDIKKVPYVRGQNVKVVYVEVEVEPPPLPEVVNGEVVFESQTVELLKKADRILAAYRSR